MRFVGIITALLIMIMPRAAGVAIAADPVRSALYSSHPAWMSIASPVLIMLGCILVGLAGLGRMALREK